MSDEFLRNNIVRGPCSPVSYTSDISEAVDMSELSKQLEKIRLSCQQQKANVSSDKPLPGLPGYYDNYMPELCGLFDKISADDEDDMFSWQGKPESNERDDDDSINFSELFRELASGMMNHSSPQSSRCQMEEAATEEEVEVIGSDTEEEDEGAVMSTEPISSIATGFNTEKAEASPLSSACALPLQIDECYGDQKTTKLVTTGFMGNKKKEAYKHTFKASAKQKPGFKRAGKRRPEYHHFRLQRSSSANAGPRQNPVPESNGMRNYLVASANDEIKHPAYVGLTGADFGQYALNSAQQVTVGANYTPERQIPCQFVPQIPAPRVSISAMSIPEQYVLAPYLFFQDEHIIWDTESLSLHYQWLLSQR